MTGERRGRVYRRCSCRDDVGRQLGQACPRLASDGKHGTWYFAVDMPAEGGSRRTMRRGGHATKAAANRALADVTNRTAQGVRVDDRETVATFLARWLQVKATEAKATTVRSYRAHVDNVIVPANRARTDRAPARRARRAAARRRRSRPRSGDREAHPRNPPLGADVRGEDAAAALQRRQ